MGRPITPSFGPRIKVFITTSSFSSQVMEYVKTIDAKIILTGGKRLADLMIVHHVGVTTVAAYEIKRVELDYFEEE